MGHILATHVRMLLGMVHISWFIDSKLPTSAIVLILILQISNCFYFNSTNQYCFNFNSKNRPSEII